jgi:hypothetical protein
LISKGEKLNIKDIIYKWKLVINDDTLKSLAFSSL